MILLICTTHNVQVTPLVNLVQKITKSYKTKITNLCLKLGVLREHYIGIIS